jgi:hypothetical protein
MNFIVNERLQWESMEPKGKPFECPGMQPMKMRTDFSDGMQRT